MARGRMISKCLSTSERFASLHEHAGELAEFCQALFPLLVSHADDFGRMQGDAFTVKHLVHPTSPRPLSDFQLALVALHESGLTTSYLADDVNYLQINQFDEHQAGLHKRTDSKIPPIPPGNSRKFPEIPGNSWSRARAEENRTELKRTELKGREEKNRGNSKGVNKSNLVGNQQQLEKANGNGQTNARSKRPIFSGQRFVVFDWMLEDLARTLGSHTDAFDLHSWFFDLDAQAVKSNLVMPKSEQWTWLQAQLLTEAQKRRLPIAAPVTHSTKTKHNIAELQKFARGDA